MSTILQPFPVSRNTCEPPDSVARVSVGLPVYNGENFLAAAIDSVLAQTFRDFALIISDNGSTDGTEDICRRYAAGDARIRYYRAGVNRGIVWNFNEVFRLSTSEYFMWFSHDDALAPQYLERCVAVLDSDPTAVLAYAACSDIDAEGRVLGVRRSRLVMDAADLVVRFRNAIRLEHLCEPWCGLTRAEVLRKTVLFGSYADYDRVTIAELGLYGRLIEIPEPLFSNREHSNRSHRVYDDRLTRTRWLDPRNANAMAFPHSRELREFWKAVCRAPLTRRDRLRCARELAAWAVRYRGRLVGDVYAIGGEMLRSIEKRMPSRRRVLGWGALLVLLVGAVGIGTIRETRWRAQVVLEKATGKLPDMGWSDLLWMLRPGSGVYLEPLVDTPNPFEVIENPLHSKADVAAGRRLFGQVCSSCHGDDARGGPGGPSLHEHAFKQGRRPWALYRTIELGVPGTAMAGHELPRRDLWRLVAYLEEVAGSPSMAGSAGNRVAIRDVTPEDLRAASQDPDEWLMYSGTYDGHRYSALSQIDRDSVGSLRVAWVRQLPDAQLSVETTPLVRGSVMFLTESTGQVLALDAGSGSVLWTFSRPLPQQIKLCCGAQNRGVALLGDRVYVGTLDAHLLALDAHTGRLVWDVAVADGNRGYSITSAPLAVGDMIVTGVAGGEYDTRGFIAAYDAASGKLRWRFDTVPAAGDAGSETWDRRALRNGGAPPWLTGAFDPGLDLIYWGVGNPHPNFFGVDRAGDDLYSNSVVALDASTGKVRWHFQFTPHDLHDWDAAQTPILADADVDGTARKLIAWPNRNGFYYVLDRTTGKYLFAAPFVKQNWTDGLDARGRPRVRPASIPTRRGALVYPSVTGATNWWAASYDAQLGLVFVPTLERGSYFFASPERRTDEQGETLGSSTSMVPGERLVTAVEALEITTGKVRWRHANSPRFDHGQTGGLLSTAGGLVFGGDMGVFHALDADTGKELWRFPTGAQILAAPISYELQGQQYVAIAAGRDVFAFSLPAAAKQPGSLE